MKRSHVSVRSLFAKERFVERTGAAEARMEHGEIRDHHLSSAKGIRKSTKARYADQPVPG